MSLQSLQYHDSSRESVYSKTDIEFQFVDGMTQTYTSEVRALVLRNHHARKRANRKEKNGSWRRRAKRHLYASPHESPESPDRANHQREDEMDRTDSSCILSSTIDPGGMDPFSSFPRKLTRFEDRLVYHYANDSHTHYGLDCYALFNPSRDIMFSQNIRDGLSLTAMLFYAASLLESRTVLALGVTSSRYNAILCQMINQRLLSEAASPSSALITAICGAIATYSEVQWVFQPSQKAVEMSVHLNGLATVIRAAGGWTAVEDRSDALCYLINWIDICCFGYISIASISESPTKRLGTTQKLPKPRSILYARVKDFFGWYRMLHSDATETQRRFNDSDGQAADFIDLFRSGGSVYKFIRELEQVTLRPVVPLLYANTVRWLCRHFPQGYGTETALFNKWRASIQAMEVTQHGSLVSLTWALISDIQRQRLMNRHLLAILRSQLYVVSFLSLETVHLLEATLLDFLQKDGKDNLCPTWWSPEQFRDAVLDDLVEQASPVKFERQDSFSVPFYGGFGNQ